MRELGLLHPTSKILLREPVLSTHASNGFGKTYPEDVTLNSCHLMSREKKRGDIFLENKC